jgi:hypothetical protein
MQDYSLGLEIEFRIIHEFCTLVPPRIVTRHPLYSRPEEALWKNNRGIIGECRRRARKIKINCSTLGALVGSACVPSVLTDLSVSLRGA